MNEPNEKNIKQDNKLIVRIIYILMIIIAIGGPILAINEDLFIDKTEIDEYEEDYYYEDDYEDEDDYYYDYEEDEEYITSLDDYLDKYTFTVTKSDREELINASSIKNTMSDEIYGAMFNETISNDFKLYYTANRLGNFVRNVTNEYVIGKISISEEKLLENAKKIFANVELPKNYYSEYSYFGTYQLNCKNGTCTFIQDTFGITDISPADGYETKITELGNTLRTQVIYIDEENSDYNYETDIYKFTAKLYNTHNGPLIKKVENYEIDLSKDIDVFNEFSPHYDTIDEYIYLFDSSNRLLSVTKNRLN